MKLIPLFLLVLLDSAIYSQTQEHNKINIDVYNGICIPLSNEDDFALDNGYVIGGNFNFQLNRHFFLGVNYQNMQHLRLYANDGASVNYSFFQLCFGNINYRNKFYLSEQAAFGFLSSHSEEYYITGVAEPPAFIVTSYEATNEHSFVSSLFISGGYMITSHLGVNLTTAIHYSAQEWHYAYSYCAGSGYSQPIYRDGFENINTFYFPLCFTAGLTIKI